MLLMFLPVKLSLTKMRSRSNFASCSLNLRVVMSSGLILQICLILALSFLSEGLAWSMAKLHWRGALYSSHKIATGLVREVVGSEIQ